MSNSTTTNAAAIAALNLALAYVPVAKKGNEMQVYEVFNPTFSDMNLEQQIEAGINDWICIDSNGREFFRQSKSAAIKALQNSR